MAAVMSQWWCFCSNSNRAANGHQALQPANLITSSQCPYTVTWKANSQVKKEKEFSTKCRMRCLSFLMNAFCLLSNIFTNILMILCNNPLFYHHNAKRLLIFPYSKASTTSYLYFNTLPFLLNTVLQPFFRLLYSLYRFYWNVIFLSSIFCFFSN